jgi:hypothetical protein
MADITKRRAYPLRFYQRSADWVRRFVGCQGLFDGAVMAPASKIL